MSLFSSIFCTIFAFSLYGEYVVCSFLPNGVFLPCDVGLDCFTAVYVIIKKKLRYLLLTENGNTDQCFFLFLRGFLDGRRSEGKWMERKNEGMLRLSCRDNQSTKDDNHPCQGFMFRSLRSLT